MSIELECLMGVVGIISPEVKENSVEKAVRLHESMRRRLTKWVASPDLTTWQMPLANKDGEQPDATKLVAKLNHPSDFTAQLHDMHEAVELQAMISDARALMVRRWPDVVAKDALDDTIFQPGEDEQQDWLAELAVVDGPERLALEIEMGTLTPNLVKVFRLSYPEWYAELAADANAAIDAATAGSTRQLEEAAEVIMQVFLETGQVAGAPDKAPDEGEEPPGDGGTKLRSDAAKSPSERAST